MDVNAIFNAFDRASDYIGLRDQQMRKREQLSSVTAKRCGNCEHWMKTTCAPEKKHGQFKSCASIACGAFQQSWSSRDLETKFSGELEHEAK